MKNECVIKITMNLDSLESGIVYDCDLYAFKAYKVYRSALRNSMRELSCSGVYFLDCGLRDSQQKLKRQIYIGESGNVSERLKRHNSKPPAGLGKEGLEWNSALCFLKVGLSERTRLRLEKRLVNFFKNEGRERFDVYTINVDSEEFEDSKALANALEEIRSYLAAMGIDTYFKSDVERIGKRFFCRVPNLDQNAYGYPTPAGFVVKKDSHVSNEKKTNFLPNSYWKLRQELEDDGTIHNGQFVRDYEFRSASEAAAVVRGRSSNGQNEWRIHVGQNEMSMKEFQSNESN